MVKLWQKITASALCLGLLAAPAVQSFAADGMPFGQPFPHMDHVFVIMMENHSYSQILNPANPNTPFIQALANKYGSALDYYGVTHPSLPNYAATLSGSNWGSLSDDAGQNAVLNHTNLVDQLEARHVSWKGYMESMPTPGFLGGGYVPTDGAGAYLLRHNPFMLFPDIYANPARAAKVVPLHQLTTDLANNDVPDFVWITPDVCNDMHGGNCPDNNNDTLMQQAGNAFIQKWVTAIMQSKAWVGNSTIFITFDEGSHDNSGCCDSPLIQPNGTSTTKNDLTTATVYGGGRVPMIVIARHGVRGYTNTTPYNHYSLLRTIEQNWHLGYLQNAGDSQQVKSLKAFLVPNRPLEGVPQR